ncbi:MAG: hypothetical protein IJT94_06780 [Oscillibacter sp.]|nr:hypothetical protein [Oscillibacter sp.]
MREVFWGTSQLSALDGCRLSCEYRVLVRTCPPPVQCESYGVKVILTETGEEASAMDLTVLPDRIAALADMLVRCGVTPCALNDVVTDWL